MQIELLGWFHPKQFTFELHQSVTQKIFLLLETYASETVTQYDMLETKP